MGFQSNMNDVHVKRGGNRWYSTLFGRSSEETNLVPKGLLQEFGSYPNLLNITDEMRDNFHPVIKLPLRENAVKEEVCNESELSQHRNSIWPWKRRNRHKPSYCTRRKMIETYDYIVKDLRQNKNKKVLLEGGVKVPQLLASREDAIKYANFPKQSKQFDVGRYDEDRRSMYTSSLFDNDKHRRTVHIGIDIGGPVDTPCHAFEAGIIHSAGYNEALGDYGHVIVIEHHLKNEHTHEATKVYALYGHLSAKSINFSSASFVDSKLIQTHIIDEKTRNFAKTQIPIHSWSSKNGIPFPLVTLCDQRDHHTMVIFGIDANSSH